MSERPEVGDPELRAAAHDACTRFFGDPPIQRADLADLIATRPLSATTWAEPGRDIMADINECMAMLEAAPPPPRLRVEVDAIALDYIRTMFGQQPAEAVSMSPYLSPLAALAATPIVLDENMAPGGWRAIDSAGHVWAEGNILGSIKR